MPQATSLVKRVVNEAIKNNNLLEINYRKKSTGRTVLRTVEPYEIKDEMKGTKKETYLFAYDVSKSVMVKGRKTKKWLVDRFIWIRPVKDSYFVSRY